MNRFVIIYLALFVLVLSSCQPSDSGKKDAIVSGLNGHCQSSPGTCNTSAYQQQIQNNNYGQGYYPYGYNSNYGYNYDYSNYYNNPFTYYNNSAYLCSCPYGTYPTYNPYTGLGCIRSYPTMGMYGYFYLGYGGISAGWGAIPQLQSYGTSCYNGAIQSCTINQNVANCPAGYVCRPNSQNSSVGLCVFSHR